MNNSKLEIMETDGQLLCQLVPELLEYNRDYIPIATFYLYDQQFDRILRHFSVLEAFGKAKRTHTLSFLMYGEEHHEVIAEIAKILIPAY